MPTKNMVCIGFTMAEGKMGMVKEGYNLDSEGRGNVLLSIQ